MMKSKTNSWAILLTLGAVVISFFTIFPKSLMAESFDYYSHLPNPPKAKDEPHSEADSMRIEGELAKFLIAWPKQRPLTNQSNLQVLLIPTPKQNEGFLTVEKFEFRSSNVPKIDFVEMHDRPRTESTVESRRYVEHRLRPGWGSFVIEYKIKNYTQPYQDLVLDLELRVVAKDGTEEIIKKTIPLYRGVYKISGWKLFWGKMLE